MNHAEIVVQYEAEQKYALRLGITLETKSYGDGEQRFLVTDGGVSFVLKYGTIDEVSAFLEGYSRAKESFAKTKKGKK